MQVRSFHSWFIRGLAVMVLPFSALCLAAPAPDAATYQLTDARLGKYEQATEAMYVFFGEHPELAGVLESDEGGEGDLEVTDTTQRLDKYAPGLRAAVERSGMSLEEYFTFTMVMIKNAFAAGMAEQFGGMDESKLGALERANMAFMTKNMERMQRFTKAMEEKYAHLKESGEEDEYVDEEGYE